jgi:hypothetical protein
VATLDAALELEPENEEIQQVRKRVFLRCHFILKMPSFCQDRLGTNIGKALKQRVAFLIGARGDSAEGDDGGTHRSGEGDGEQYLPGV